MRPLVVPMDNIPQCEFNEIEDIPPSSSSTVCAIILGKNAA